MPEVERLDSLIRRATNRVGTRKCWAGTLTGEAKKFIDQLTEIERGEAMRVNRAEVRRILDADLSLVPLPSAEAVKRHFRGECECARKA